MQKEDGKCLKDKKLDPWLMYFAESKKLDLLAGKDFIREKYYVDDPYERFHKRYFNGPLPRAGLPSYLLKCLTSSSHFILYIYAKTGLK
ncbi:unnamed protein product [Gordionus sp. m RMFG-2023]